jgi:hypothetical protein
VAGAARYILIYTLLGYLFRPAVLQVVNGIHLPLGLLGSLIPLAALVIWIARARRGLRHAKPTRPAR